MSRFAIRRYFSYLAIAFLVMGVVFFGWRVGFCPVVGKMVAAKKLAVYAKAAGLKVDTMKVSYDWYNGRYVGRTDGNTVLSYYLPNNSIHDELANTRLNADLRQIYEEIVPRFPKNLDFPGHITMWSTVNADNYDLKAQRLYLLGVYNRADLTAEESVDMPAQIAADFIDLLGEEFNISGIQLIYADINGMYDIAIRADSFKPLSREQLRAATVLQSEKELPEDYGQWLQNLNQSRSEPAPRNKSRAATPETEMMW